MKNNFNITHDTHNIEKLKATAIKQALKNNSVDKNNIENIHDATVAENTPAYDYLIDKKEENIAENIDILQST